jgi:hypothetical protein
MAPETNTLARTQLGIALSASYRCSNDGGMNVMMPSGGQTARHAIGVAHSKNERREGRRSDVIRD